MSDITLDLTNESLFIIDELRLDTNITFFFGKNGTGKTTLTNLFRNQSSAYDVRIFQGFEGVVGAANRLNAVILGEKNVEIDKEIEKKNIEISKRHEQIKHINENILESGIKLDNLWYRNKTKQTELDTQRIKIDNFYTDSARKIRNKSNPQISDPNFNKSRFEDEIKNAIPLTSGEITKMKETLSASVREVKTIRDYSVNTKDLLDEVNELLIKRVEPQVLIDEFFGNKDKQTFAEEGLRLHKAGEKCAFCGGIYTLDREKKVSLFFSADEMELLRNNIKELMGKINVFIENLTSLEMETSTFYPEHINAAILIQTEFINHKGALLRFFNAIKAKTDEKQKSLTDKNETVTIPLPMPLSSCIEEYNELVKKNNSSDLIVQQRNAKDKLRFYEIKNYLDEFKYDVENVRLYELQISLNQIKKDIEKEESSKKQLEIEISKIEEEIAKLRAKTKNEKKLADEINKKLKLYINFELVYMKDTEEKGFYQIKCNQTSEIREVDKISTGEKNIIAFLYFVEKLSEVRVGVKLPRLIIFDDPMNSNDDTMQYVIIEELQKLFPLIKDSEKMLLLTHNSHFYLNVKYTLHNYTKNTFLHMHRSGKSVEIKRILSKEEDFKTNYEVLWKELRFLFDASEANASMLLNPIRRIIETYTKFNVISEKTMLSPVIGAAKLFNVNSHSIDDLEAELSGLDKQSILEILNECFVKNGAGEHFEQHWGSNKH